MTLRYCTCGTSPVLKLKKDVVNEKNNLINNANR